MADVVVAGHICLDIIPSLPPRIRFEPGRLVEAGRATLSTGGTVSNTGLALHKLGVAVELVGKVGDDLFGSNVRTLLNQREEGLGDRMSVAQSEPTSYTVVISLSGEDRMFLHAPGCNDTFTADDVPIESLRNCRLMHFGYPPLMARMYADDGRELERLLRKAKEAGATTSLDMSLPDPDTPSGQAAWNSILTRVLPYVDIFLPSYDELMFMLERGSYRDKRTVPVDALADEALALGAKMVGLKLGEGGFFLKTGSTFEGFGRATPDRQWLGQTVFSPCFQVEVAGTTGSGDATIAGFLMGLLRGFSPTEAVRAAVAVGACCCERPDATSGVRTWEETEKRIVAGWPMK